MIKLFLITLTAFFFIATANPTYCQSNANNDAWSERKDLTRSKDKIIDFYGKVVDQDLMPVANAQVVIHLRHFDLTVPYFFTSSKEINLNTDSRGLFQVTGKTGSLLFIDNIVKRGYEFNFSGERGFEPGQTKADKNNPIIFTLRKKEPAVLVIPHEFGFSFDSTVSEKELDLVNGQSGEIGKLGTRDWQKDEHADIRIKSALSNTSSYVITFSTPEKDSGLIASSELLYVVPPKGYVPSYTITLPFPGSYKKQLYVKGRQGKTYSRLAIGINATGERLGVRIRSWTNPNGSRNVDYDAEIYAGETVRKHEEDKTQAIEREKRKLLEPFNCCIYSFAREDSGPLNCGLPTGNACSKGSGHPWACEKLDWCKEKNQ